MGNNFSRFERLVARGLSVSPGLKAWAKKSYQRVVYFRHKKPHACETRHGLKMVSGNAPESFFGYYDKSPVSPDGAHIIYQSTTQPTQLPPDPLKPVEVVCQNLQTSDVVARLDSAAYNWQQGTKLQWIGPDRFAFNAYDRESACYVAQVYDLAQGKVAQTLPMPIYDCYGDQFALTLNFDRLARLAPDYGYFCHMDRDLHLKALDDDGIWRMDMSTGEDRLILSLQTLAQLCPLTSMQGAKHSVNHIMIAPDGKRFMVIHRWYQSGRRYDRLVVCAVDSSSPTVVADEGMVSHCFWRNSAQIFSYLRSSGKDAYFMLNADTGAVRQVGEGIIDGFGDGHPHIHGSKVVFDTYPNKARMKKLFLYDLDDGALEELGEFFEGFKFYAETRCDLHPRFSPNGKQVFFDSVHNGRRELYAISLASKGS